MAGTDREESTASRAADHIAGHAENPADFSNIQKASSRYSVFVSLMRYALPGVAVALVILVIGWAQLQGDKRFRLNFASVTPEGSDTLTMVQPRFTGVDADERPFTVTANAANQVAVGSPLVDLDAPVADVTLNDGTWVALRSTEGTFDQDTNQIELRGAVNLFHDKGYEFATSRAFLSLHDGKAYGDEPVEGQGPFGHLESEGFQVTEHGKIVFFTGRSKLLLYPKPRGGKS